MQIDCMSQRSINVIKCDLLNGRTKHYSIEVALGKIAHTIWWWQ